jgi:acyl transferase domain-containing protein/NADPH:quinone reductase-like Zn-dependent oxidoreductase
LNFNPAREGKESAAAPIALMGMACRFPGSSNTPADFWEHLLSGHSAIGEIPADRFSIAAHVDANVEAPGKSYSRWGGFIDDIAGFDPAMFEISPREAQTMDPQQRLLLMVAYEAMEDAGLTRAQLGDVRTGVYVGVSSSDYAAIQRQQSAYSDVYSGTGSALSIVANRLSHRFDLNGPSLSIDTACSSSLVALDQAVTALNSGRIDIAIVAGAHLLIDPSPFVAFSKAGMLSPTGRLSAFDRRANGYVRGEGIGAVLLMRAADALYQGRRTRALIRATASNQDGRTPTLTAPDAMAQRAMMRQLVDAAGVSPHDVHYVEAHGTGTPVGDPIEASAIGNVFGGALRQAPLLLGSVKPNIGHLEAAAGIASLVKAVLSLENRRVPASINFEDPNPAIAFAAHNMAVPQGVTALDCDRSLLIAVNSFGFGGTNAGVLLESVGQPATSSEERTVPSRSVAVPISAASPEALHAMAGNLQHAVAEGGLKGRTVRDIATSLGSLREGLGYRATIIAGTETELLSGLSRVAGGEEGSPVRGMLPSIVSGKSRQVNRLAFTYAGQGGQWPGMARRLLHEEPVFAVAFREFDRTFEGLSGWSVRPELQREGETSRLGQSRFAMPAIFGVQLGLGALWRSWGVNPDFVIGHSFGELAAAQLAGAIDLETATRMIHVRCQIRERIGRDGSMLAVGLAPAELPALLGPDSPIDLAAVNADSMVTLAGPVEAIGDLSDRLARERPSVLVRQIQSDTAWHSRQLAPLEVWFRNEIGEVRWQTPRLAFVSTVSGRVESRLDADYWWRNLRQPVRYRDAVMMALDLGANGFLELSPHRVLSGLNATNAAGRGESATIANSLVRNEDDFRALAVAAGQLQSAGIAIDWQAAGGGTARAEGLPTYPWQLSQHWRHSEEASDQLHVAPAFPLLGKRARGPDPIWTNEISLGGFPYLKDHVVGGDVVFPAAGYFEIMLSAGRDVFGDVSLELEDFEISTALFIGAEEQVLLSTRFDPSRHRIEVRTRTRDGAAEWIVRASARLHPTDMQPELLMRAPDSTAETIDAETFYARAVRAGFGYGSAFSGMTRATADSEWGIGSVEAPAQVSLEGSSTHPSVLDAALQLAIPILAGTSEDQPNDGEEPARYVPKRLRRLRFSGSLPRHILVQAHVGRDVTGALSASYRLAATDGRCLLAIEGLELTPMGRQVAVTEPERTRPTYFVENFVPFQVEDPVAINGDWAIVSGGGEDAATLAFALKQAGASVSTLDLAAEAPQGQDLLTFTRAQVATSIATAQTVVFHATPGDVAEDGLVAVCERLALQLVAAAQAVQSLEPVAGPREFIVVTHGARQLPQDKSMSLAGLAASSLVGLVRTIASENPDLSVRQVDCPRGSFAALAAGLSGAGAETELVYRDGAWWVPRLVADSLADLPRGLLDIDPTSASDTFQLTMKAPGSSSGLFLEACAIQRPAAGEVLVETAAVGLNFRDVMAVTGLLPAGAEPDPAWLNLGLEFSGVVRQVGPDVVGLAAGDRVMGMARACLRGVLAAPAASVIRLPPGISFDEAATIPSAFATAHYALVRAGRLQPGERVLIHLGTGGVGLAAIQVARSLGAEISATAGSEAKRAYLRSLGIAQVFNSRSLGFADDVMSATGGRGVDVVLNALPTHYIAKGLDVLAPFGRFLEIGKRDVYDDTAIGMHALRRNISFNVIDLAAMGVQRPDLLGTVLGEVLARFEDGTYRPLPVTRFPIDRAAEAFDLMAKGRHMGKVVIGIGKERVRARASGSQLPRHWRHQWLRGGSCPLAGSPRRRQHHPCLPFGQARPAVQSGGGLASLGGEP